MIHIYIILYNIIYYLEYYNKIISIRITYLSNLHLSNPYHISITISISNNYAIRL